MRYAILAFILLGLVTVAALPAGAQTPAAAPTAAQAPPASVQPVEVKPPSSQTTTRAGTDQRSLFPTRPVGGVPQATSGGPLTAVWVWMLDMQQRMHRGLAAAVKDFKTRDPLSAALALITVSFLYGVFHAAGPGHGKAVISSYVLANERTVRRGIFLSFLAAGVQGLSALVVVGVLVLVLKATGMTIKATEHWIETISWALVALVGAWLLYGQVKVLLAGWGKGIAVGGHDHRHVSDHAHGHVHDAGCGCGHEHHAHDHDAPALLKQANVGGARLVNPSAKVEARAPVEPQAGCAHAHESGHDHSECCGHAHMPSPEQLEGDLSWSKALAIAFSVGIRPCTGAILVLVLAISLGVPWVGVLATFAMSIGTAITVSALAALAVGSRELAKRMAGAESRWGWRIERAAGLVGALLVLGLGTAFFFASLQPQTPF